MILLPANILLPWIVIITELGNWQAYLLLIPAGISHICIVRDTATQKFIGYFGEPTSKKNLSAANFYVGITDPATGIFISGDGMSNNVSMNVSTLSQKGGAYEKP